MAAALPRSSNITLTEELIAKFNAYDGLIERVDCLEQVVEDLRARIVALEQAKATDDQISQEVKEILD